MVFIEEFVIKPTIADLLNYSLLDSTADHVKSRSCGCLQNRTFPCFNAATLHCVNALLLDWCSLLFFSWLLFLFIRTCEVWDRVNGKQAAQKNFMGVYLNKSEIKANKLLPYIQLTWILLTIFIIGLTKVMAIIMRLIRHQSDLFLDCFKNIITSLYYCF